MFAREEKFLKVSDHTFSSFALSQAVYLIGTTLVLRFTIRVGRCLNVRGGRALPTVTTAESDLSSVPSGATTERQTHLLYINILLFMCAFSATRCELEV